MSLVLALVLQAEIAAPASPVLVGIDFDLARYRITDFEAGIGARRCNRGNDPSTITVCARHDGGAYPFARMTRLYGPERIVADTRIAGNLRGGLHMQAVNLDPTATDSSLPHDISNRIMLGLRLPF